MTNPTDPPTPDSAPLDIVAPVVDVLDLTKMKADLEAKRSWLLGQIAGKQHIREAANVDIRELRVDLETTERVLNSLTPRKRTPRAAKPPKT